MLAWTSQAIAPLVLFYHFQLTFEIHWIFDYQCQTLSVMKNIEKQNSFELLTKIDFKKPQSGPIVPN